MPLSFILLLLCLWNPALSYAQELDVVQPSLGSVQETVVGEGSGAEDQNSENIKEIDSLEALEDLGPYARDMMVRSRIRNDLKALPSNTSLFFTVGELNLIREAKKGFVTRPVTDQEIKESEDNIANSTRPPRGPREIILGGIIYKTSDDWTIWINGQKITPTRIPKEILDIRVYKDTVRLKWFDAYTNQVFPVKIRSHQRFNIDTRIFLPG